MHASILYLPLVSSASKQAPYEEESFLNPIRCQVIFRYRSRSRQKRISLPPGGFLPNYFYFYFYNSGSLIPSSCIFRLRMSPLIDAYIMGSITYRLLPPPIPRNFIFRWGVESFRERPITRFGRSSDIFSRKRLTNSQLAVFRRDIFSPPQYIYTLRHNLGYIILIQVGRTTHASSGPEHPSPAAKRSALMPSCHHAKL